MKITYLLPQKGLGGGYRSTVQISNALLSRGHNVKILYRSTKPTLKARLRKTYLRFKDCWIPDWLGEFKGELIEYGRLEPGMFSPNELIISVCNRTAQDMWELPGDTTIKIFHSRGVDLLDWDGMLRTWKLPVPKIVTSTHLANQFKQETDQLVAGIVPNGVDLKQYFPCLPEEQRTGVGCIFHWGKAKDPASTIEVMKIIKQRMPDVPRYIFSSGRRPAGTKGTHYRRLPSIEQTREIYSKCKVWFLTSISEGFGNPILEAMACGCAVVSTDCGGPHDIIKHGENGFLVDVGNTQAIVEKTTRLLKDDQLRKKICANAMKTAQQYSWSKAAAELEKLLYSIYESKRKDIHISKEHV